MHTKIRFYKRIGNNLSLYFNIKYIIVIFIRCLFKYITKKSINNVEYKKNNFLILSVYEKIIKLNFYEWTGSSIKVQKYKSILFVGPTKVLTLV